MAVLSARSGLTAIRVPNRRESAASEPLDPDPVTLGDTGPEPTPKKRTTATPKKAAKKSKEK